MLLANTFIWIIVAYTGQIYSLWAILEHLTQRNKHIRILSEHPGVTDGFIRESADSALQDPSVCIEKTVELFGRRVLKQNNNNNNMFYGGRCELFL